MANMKSGLLQVVSDLPQRTSVQQTSIEAPATGAGEAMRGAANQLGSIGNEIGRMADHAAAVEGRKAGLQAGLDPEFRPTDAMTIRGEAYDQAGTEVFATTAKIEIENSLDAASQAARGNPAAFAKAAGQIRQTWMSKLPADVQPDFEHIFRRSTLVFNREAARAHAARVADEQRAAMGTEIDSGIKGLQQRAYSLGLDAKADETLAADIGLLEKTLKRTGIDGQPLVSPSHAAKLIEQAKGEVTDARLMGAFSRLPSLEAKQAFIDKFEADFGASQGLAKSYDFNGFERASGALKSELRSAHAAAGASQRGIAEDIKAVGNMAEKGYAAAPEQLAQLRAHVAATNDPTLSAALAETEELASWQANARRLPPAELEQRVAAERQRLQADGATPKAVARLAMAEHLQQAMDSELKSDQLGWADRTGLLKVAPLDLGGPNAGVTLKARIAQAEQAAEYYHRPPQYLRPEERQTLSMALSQGGDNALMVAGVIANAAPEKAAAIMAELAPDAPSAAMLGGHVAENGVTPLTRDAAAGIAFKKTPGVKLKMPQGQEVDAAARDVLGLSLAGSPATESGVKSLAAAAYEMRAQREGKDAFDPELYAKTLRETLGENTVNGETYGGLVDYNGAKVIIPSSVPQAKFEDVIHAITNDDLYLLGSPVDAQKRALSVTALRRAVLVPVGDGRYRAALGDPNSDTPQWMADPLSGAAWTLDLNRILPDLLKRMNAPDSYQHPPRRGP